MPKYLIRIKYDAEVEFEMFGANSDDAEQEALERLEFDVPGAIISYDIVDTEELDEIDPAEFDWNTDND